MDKRYPTNDKFTLNVDLTEYFNEYASNIYGADNDDEFTPFDALIGLDSEAYLKQYDPSVLDILRTPISHSIIKFEDYRQINREYRSIKVPKGFVDLEVVKSKQMGAKKLQKYNHELRIELPKLDRTNVSINFIEGKVYMLTIRVLRSFLYLKGKRDRKEVNRFHYEITLLSTNTLLDLKNHLMCTNDLGICKKVGSNLNRSLIPKSKDLYPSSFLYIDSVFYNDLSNRDSIDLSKTIQEWATKNDCGPFTSGSINTRLEQLKPRFGYPYLYYHLGYCEHLFYFADARLIQPYESRNILNYPCYSAFGYKKTKFCRTCNQKVCKWIVISTGGVFPNDVTTLCDFCVKSYCFVNGKQIHNVDIYPYYDGSALF